MQIVEREFVALCAGIAIAVIIAALKSWGII